MSKKEKNANSKKNLYIIIGSITFALVVVGVLVGLLLGNNTKIKLANGEAEIKKVKDTEIKYTKFDNGLVSLTIPEGWKVEIPVGVDYIHYFIKVSNPSDPDYMFMFGLKLEGFLKTTKARSVYKGLYPSAPFSLLPSLDGENAEALFKTWNETADYVNNENLKYEYLPKLTDYTTVDNLGKGLFDSDILRGNFKNSKGELNEGIFNASVMSSGSYYINEDMFNLWSAKVDVAPLNVYNIIMMTTPMGELDKWESIYTKMFNSIEFSQSFIDGFNKEEASIMSTFKANQQIYNEISDMIMDSWKQRNKSYDIISQKQSDATLGYERVYDTDTGEIYKAYNGFMDDYSGDRYQSVTDDMYTEGYSGYIEKVG